MVVILGKEVLGKPHKVEAMRNPEILQINACPASNITGAEG